MLDARRTEVLDAGCWMLEVSNQHLASGIWHPSFNQANRASCRTTMPNRAIRQIAHSGGRCACR